MQIRSEDVERSISDAMAIAMAELGRAVHEQVRDFERTWAWWVRRNRALMILGGWRPPSAAALWWEAHEDAALAYAEGFEPD